MTGVTVKVTSLSALVQASIDDSCAGNGITCIDSANNDSTFSVAIGLGGPLTPLTQTLSAVASDSCDIPAGPDRGCTMADTASTSTLPSPFNYTAAIADLGQFIGPGTFAVTPQITLGGANNWDHASTGFENSVSANALTQWSGTIDVIYQFSSVGGVPEPATLFLVGAGLAGAGFARRTSRRG